MAEAEKVILTNMCMVYNGNNVLVLNRLDDKWKGLTFPGGHIERCESFTDAVIREVKEETGLTLTSYKYRGIVTFISDVWETEYMHLFTADKFTGTIITCSEGTLEWVDNDILYSLPTWEGDRIFLELIRKDAPFFSLKLEYQGEALVSAVLDGKKIR